MTDSIQSFLETHKLRRLNAQERIRDEWMSAPTRTVPNHEGAAAKIDLSKGCLHFVLSSLKSRLFQK